MTNSILGTIFLALMAFIAISERVEIRKIKKDLSDIKKNLDDHGIYL